MIETKDIEKLADLSRIRLTTDEKEQMRKEISSVISYVDQLKEVVGADSPKRTAGTLKNILREDEIAHPSGEFSELLLANAPATEGQYVKVKKIL